MRNKKVLFGLIVGLMISVLAGCANSSGDNGNESSSSNGAAGGSSSTSSGSSAAVRKEATGKIGKFEGAYLVGDIVFKDGSATPYTDTLTLTPEQKAAAIAVIFYKGTGLNSYVNHKDDTSKTRTLGMGLLHSEDVPKNSDDEPRMPWCSNDTVTAKGYEYEFSSIESDYYMEDGVRKFRDDKNGSDNLEQISQFLQAKQEDDTADPDLYPAFYFAKNYKDQPGSRVKNTAYETGWFLPSIAEIWELGKVKETVDAASQLCGGSKFVLSGHDNDTYTQRPYYYWTSTDTMVYMKTDEYYAVIFSFLAQELDSYDKTNELFVLAIREF